MRITRELYKTPDVPAAPTPVESAPPRRGAAAWALKLPDGPDGRHLSLTRTLKDRYCRHPHRTGGDIGLREVKPLARGQRASGRGGTGVPNGRGGWPPCWPWIWASRGASSGTTRSQAGPGAWASGWLKSGPCLPTNARHFCHLLLQSAGLGLLQAPERGGSLPLTQPGPLTGTACPLVTGRMHF